MKILELFSGTESFSKVAKELGSNTKIHLRLLEHLGLIENTSAIYKCGNKLRTRREVEGWRLK